ncbi:hypothetical protein L596_028424 [Steinernema carpocapsae]|uniref:Uncharacterized protein n=1 Tax=Steinernema carpocapsae TaxID=34508 RepID=A0A4U5LYG7_STECR|nr:hypothetical protein L596_028424 [Steinernema carpocapsae]
MTPFCLVSERRLGGTQAFFSDTLYTVYRKAKKNLFPDTAPARHARRINAAATTECGYCCGDVVAFLPKVATSTCGCRDGVRRRLRRAAKKLVAIPAAAAAISVWGLAKKHAK